MAPFLLVDGAMNHGGREGLGGRGEEADGLTARDLTGRVIGLAIKVHKTVGPGLLESVYEDCLCYEMMAGGLTFRRQVEVPLIYGDVRLPRAYRADIIVEDNIIIEVKSIDRPNPACA